MQIISLITAIISMLATIIIGILQVIQNKKIDKRDEQRRKDLIYSEATKFITKYSLDYKYDIQLLPLCVMAYKYNPIYPYHRQIYSEFCSLVEEVQNCILERCNIDISSSKTDKFYDKIVKLLESTIKTNYPNDDGNLFHNNGKYFKYSLSKYGNEEIPDISCNADKWFVKINVSSDNTMDYKEHITNLLAYEKEHKPIERLMNEYTSMGVPTTGAGILLSYLACIVAKYAFFYSHDDLQNEIGCIEDYPYEVYMEDLFLDALLNIYYIAENKKLIEN